MGGSKGIAIIILLNVIFFTFVSSSCVIPKPPTTPPAPKKPYPPKVPVTPPPAPAKKKPYPPKAPVTPAPAPEKPGKCPIDTLKFAVCGDMLGMVHQVIGAPPSSECCALINGLADVEAAVCLCTAIKANVLGMVNMTIPVALSLLINSCGKKVPEGFQCA